MRAILSFSSPRCAIIACLNVIYTRFGHAMIPQLNRIWGVWACARAIARHSWPGLVGYLLEDLVHSLILEVLISLDQYNKLSFH